MSKDIQVKADKLVKEITDIIIKNNCNITNKAVFDLAIYIIEREKKVIQNL